MADASYLENSGADQSSTTELLMIESYLFILLLVLNGEVSNAMDAELKGRALMDSTVQPALISPVSPRHSRANHSLVAVIVVLMVLVTGALFCCCYMWERQLRLRIQATRSSTHSLQDPVGSNNHSTSTRLAQTVSSPSVIVFQGDDIPRSMAWAVPQGIPTSVASEATLQQTPASADQSLQKLAPK